MTTDTQLSIEDRVKKEVAFHGTVTVNSVRNDQSFVNDLGFDSLDLLECVMAIEDEFEIEIPDDDADKIRTVQQLIDYVTQHSPAAGGA